MYQLEAWISEHPMPSWYAISEVSMDKNRLISLGKQLRKNGRKNALRVIAIEEEWPQL